MYGQFTSSVQGVECQEGFSIPQQEKKLTLKGNYKWRNI